MKKRLIILCDENRVSEASLTNANESTQAMNLQVLYWLAYFPPTAPFPIQIFNIDDLPSEDLESLKKKLVDLGIKII